ncbi:MAG: xth [Panacagrimonas sp.]|jgi:exodeoxyribonuclease-3|nr:exodeoxyribonuclease III [Panacagrimonas sp.]MCC2655661.1 xth [Panacagrimonas sp.]
MPVRRAAAKSPSLRIATFNLNGVRSRLGHLLAWLKRERPDIACLQELKAPDASFPVDAIRDAGYGAVWQGQTSWNGVAILARGAEPVEICRGLPGAAQDKQSRYLEAAAHGVIVGCVYLPNGNPQPGPKFDYKLAWFDRLEAHLRPRLDADAPVIIAGDFNVVPTDEDIYDPKNWRRDALLQPQSRERWRRLLDQGWLDALQARHPGERIYTFWDYFRQHWQRDAGLRIDHLLLNRHAAPMLRDAGVDRWVRGLPQASDHAPVWIELQRVRARARTRKR